MNTKIDTQLFSAHEHALEQEACPKCHQDKQGQLQLRHGKHGPFLGCNQYPDCDYIRPLHQNDGHVVKELLLPCPECGEQDEGMLVLRQGRYGMFIGCDRFPSCHHIASLEDKPSEQSQLENLPGCPECSTGQLVERQSRFGKSFYACNAYPKCKFSLNHLPTQGICQQCGYPLLISKKLASGIKVQCASRKCQAQQE